MKNKELLAHCCDITGESGAKWFFEELCGNMQHHVTCQQKQSVAQTWGQKWRTGP